MRELTRHEIGQVSGAKSTGPSAWAAQLTSVSKCYPVFNEIFKMMNNLLGTNIPYLTVK